MSSKAIVAGPAFDGDHRVAVAEGVFVVLMVACSGVACLDICNHTIEGVKVKCYSVNPPAFTYALSTALAILRVV